jgi:hypothetical protein
MAITLEHPSAAMDAFGPFIAAFGPIIALQRNSQQMMTA